MKLYSFDISPNGKRANICAREAGVTLEASPIDIAKGENRAPDYLAMNPMGKAPTLRDGDFVLWESAAMLCYIAETSESSLWPASPRARADALRWLFFCSCHIDPYFTTLMVERFIKARRALPEDEVLTASAEAWLARFVPIVDGQLEGREHVLGRFGVADIALGCTLELSPVARFDLAPYGNVRGWLERVQGRPSWRASTAGA